MTLYVRLAQSALPIPPQPPPEPPPAPSNANCYDHATGDVVEVNSVAKLVAAVNGAPAGGRQVLVAPGAYPGGDLNFSRAGRGPVVIRPRDGRGTVTINGGKWTLRGERLVFAGLSFSGFGFNVFGEHHRITRCQVRGIATFFVQVLSATDTRIDHCDVAGYTDSTENKAFVRCNATATQNGTLRRVLVDRNSCHDLNHTVGANGQDFIGWSGQAFNVDAGLVVEGNLFERISLPGDGELVGTKTSGIVFRGNTVLNLGQAYLNAPRHGNAFELRSNWLENARVYLLGDDGLAIGNRFVGDLALPLCAGNYYGPAGASLPTGYASARRWRVIGNILDTGRILVGSSDRALGGGPSVPAAATNIVLDGPGRNVRTAGGNPHQFVEGWHAGTTHIKDDEPFEPAVKLTPADVGMSAPDPLCPQGPQA